MRYRSRQLFQLSALVVGICLLVASSSVARAQTSPLRLERIDGLSQSTAYSLLKGSHGFIWIATADGLNRFDGVEVKVYKPETGREQHRMKGRIIRSELREDANGDVWFATDVAVHRFNKKRETFTIYPLSLNGDSKEAFANPLLLKDGRVWLATAATGLFLLDTLTGNSEHYPVTVMDETGDAIQLMYKGVYDNAGCFWFATQKGLLRFDTGTKNWRRYFGDRGFYSITIWRDTIHINSGRDVFRVVRSDKNDAITLEPVLFNEHKAYERDHIHQVYADYTGNLWVGDESGNIYFKDADASTFEWRGNVNHSSAIRTNYPVYTFLYDTTGILWTGAYMIGLLKADINNNAFHVFPDPGVDPTAENVFVNAFYEEGNEVWLGTFQKGILILDKTTGAVRNLRLPQAGSQILYGNSVHIIHRDNQHNLWTSSTGYLYVKENDNEPFKSIRIPTPPGAIQNPQAWCITEYNDGWLVGGTVGLYMVRKLDARYDVVNIPWVGQSRIVSLWRAPNNEVWVAFESGGVVIINDINDQSESRRVFSDANVKSFTYDDAHDLLWISTTGGLIAYHLRSDTYRGYGDQHGLTNTYTYAAVRDGESLWVSTNAGLYTATLSFDKDQIFPEAAFTRFTKRDGLPDNQFNTWAAYRGNSGTLYFGTPGGIVWFDPKDVSRNSSVPRLVMTDIAVNGKPADSLLSASSINKLALGYLQNNLYFRFRGIEHNNPGRVQYAYKLTGWDNDWTINGTSNEVRYNNLSPGEYTFSFKAANSSGIWNEDAYQVVLVIHPPFWKTWWFYALVAAFLVSVVVSITRRIAYTTLQRKLAELERQRELDKERQRISREMHDDIGAGLTQITLISEFAKSKLTNNGAKELSEIAATSRQLVNNMSEIIWSLNPENRNPAQLLSYLREQLGKQLEYSGIQYRIEFPEDVPGIVLSNETGRNILLVTREIVNNAIKHSNATQLSVHAIVTTDGIEFYISDDGIGFEVDRQYSGNGLKNIHERVRTSGGTMEITSQPGVGSRFRFSFRK